MKRRSFLIGAAALMVSGYRPEKSPWSDPATWSTSREFEYSAHYSLRRGTVFTWGGVNPTMYRPVEFETTREKIERIVHTPRGIEVITSGKPDNRTFFEDAP